MDGKPNPNPLSSQKGDTATDQITVSQTIPAYMSGKVVKVSASGITGTDDGPKTGGVVNPSGEK